MTKGTNGAATYAMTKLLEVSTAEARDLVGGTNNFAFADWSAQTCHFDFKAKLVARLYLLFKAATVDSSPGSET